ncbi:NAD(P)-dependent oxidoreductase [uncultured Roseobacter sp.]|uniref:NAD(P)-dependent oxidoreductase n=1 Tax=uncultured Roseobacter sp. TaxID=114847 RepID=UPI002617E2B3|nr:NAD(P)-dependent oxidoreductase [uncultured Roseobacter sp.]
MERIGVVGLGRMGSAIARRMSAMGHSVQGWTRSGRAVTGVDSAPDLGSLVARSDTLILSLFDDVAVSEVLEALIGCDLTGRQIIDTSTVVPDILKTRMEAIRAVGATAVDAPISGGPDLVMAGKCGIFMGGEEAAAARAQDTLAWLSSRIFHVGPLGAGLAMKVINNGMIQTYFNGLADFMPLAKRAGLPLETALKILSGGPAGMPMVADRIPKVLGQDKEIGFTINATYKDADVFRRVMQSFDLPSPMLDSFAEMSGTAIEAGLGEDDPAAFIRFAYEGDAKP